MSQHILAVPLLFMTTPTFAASLPFTMGESGVFVLSTVGLAIVLVFKGVKTVPQGYEYTIERFGRFTRALTPGLNFITPFVDRVSEQVIMMEQVLDISQQSVITRDNAAIQADGVVFFQVLDAPKPRMRSTIYHWP